MTSPSGSSVRTASPRTRGKYHYHLVLQDTGTCELLTFDTQSKTGIGAAALLIRHYRRMR